MAEESEKCLYLRRLFTTLMAAIPLINGPSLKTVRDRCHEVELIMWLYRNSIFFYFWGIY